MTKRQKMRNITIALMPNTVDNLQKIQDIGMIPNRSEGIRQAVGRFLKQEIGNCELLGFPGGDSND